MERADKVLGGGVLTRETDDRTIGQTGTTQAGHRVGQAAAGSDTADTGFAGHTGIAIRGIGGGLLVAHVDEFDAIISEVGQNGEGMPAIHGKHILHVLFL